MNCEKICDTCKWALSRDDEGDPRCHNEKSGARYGLAHYRGDMCENWEDGADGYEIQSGADT